MAITSVTIYRRSVNLWEIVTNESADPISRDAYRGGDFGGYISITSATGTTLMPLVFWNAFEYIDEYGSNSFIPSSSQDLMQNLLDEGFFLGSSSGGGEGATAFTELTDTFPNYFGREFQILRVKSGGGIESIPLPTITDAPTANAPLVYDEGSNSYSIPPAEFEVDGYLTKEDWFRFNLRDVSTFSMIVIDANTIQHDKLIGLNTGTLAFPFMIQADNATWTEYPSDIFPYLAYDNVTGTITGFTVEVGKAVYITINEVAYIT